MTVHLKSHDLFYRSHIVPQFSEYYSVQTDYINIHTYVSQCQHSQLTTNQANVRSSSEPMLGLYLYLDLSKLIMDRTTKLQTCYEVIGAQSSVFGWGKVLAVDPADP